MKKSISVLLALFLTVLSGCSNGELNVSEEQVKSIVIEHHTSHIGKVEIISIELEKNDYIVEWENKENCEQGTDRIGGETGEVEMIEATIC